MGHQQQETEHGKTKMAKMELKKGKQIATRLQTLLQNPVQDLSPDLCDQLTMQILSSFDNSLTLLSSCCTEFAQSTQIADAADGGGSSCSAESIKKVKDRRGCYKRRKSSDSWITVSKTMEDGLAWRKYGQKEIQNSIYPRCYFRCTHKYQQGCKAIKQVQRLKENPFLYQTTYFNHHTCTDTLRAPQDFIVDPDPVDPNLLTFQQLGAQLSNNIIISPIKEEEDTQVKLEPKQDTSVDHEAQSSVDPWKDILATGSDYWFGYKPLWGTMYEKEVGSGFGSCVSTSLSGADMEVNQSDFHF